MQFLFCSKWRWNEQTALLVGGIERSEHDFSSKKNSETWSEKFLSVDEKIICDRKCTHGSRPSPHFKNQPALSGRFLLCGDEKANCFAFM
jgi:hypothetical protein